MGNIAWLLARGLTLIGIFFALGIGEVCGGQSGDPMGQTSGRIILIEPKKTKNALTVRQGKRVRPINAVEGMLVRRGHLLILSPTARATLICGDGKKRELAPGSQGCPCTSPCTPEVCGIRYDGSTIAATRGPDTENGSYPVVISPRKTRLLNLKPTILWSPIAGAKDSTAYTVTLYGEGMKPVWARQVVSGNSLAYPDDEPALTRGQTYKVVITSGLVSSEQDSSPGLGFTTLTVDQARALADEEMKYRQQKLPEMQTRFLISNLFSARELYSEAIEQLQGLYTTMKVPAVAKLLGDSYAAIGLNREAEKSYLEALRLTSADDLEGIGATQMGLAQSYEHLGMFDRAIARLEKAMAAYRRLRNVTMVKALLNEKRRLKAPRRR